MVANINIQNKTDFMLGMKYWIVMKSVIGWQTGIGSKFRRPDKCTILNSCFWEVHYFFACIFNQLGETPSNFSVELADGFVCLVVSRLKAAQSRRPPTDCPPDTWERSGVHVPPSGETPAGKQSRFLGSRHKSFSNLCLLCQDVSYKNVNLLVPNLPRCNYPRP